MVGWSQDRFTEICTKLGTFLKQAGYKEQDIFYVPVSGLSGENLTTTSTEEKLTTWYSGPTLLSAIGQSLQPVFLGLLYFYSTLSRLHAFSDGFRSPERFLNRPARLVISDIFKSTGSSSGCCLAGRMDSGMVQTGDKLLVMPLNEIANIKGSFY